VLVYALLIAMKSKVQKLLDQLGKYKCSVSRGTVVVFACLLI
jgi:hypothetical protein